MKPNRLVTILLIAVIGVLAIHVVARLTAAVRADITEDNLYSLTDGSRQIVDKMKAEGVKPIDISLYFSATTGKSLPKFIKQFIVYEDYVRTLLREYERAADGKIRLHFVDPLTDSERRRRRPTSASTASRSTSTATSSSSASSSRPQPAARTSSTSCGPTSSRTSSTRSRAASTPCCGRPSRGSECCRAWRCWATATPTWRG
jgi:ABC-type uncharacterized transport system involved in gliding motility auxiliary subunit